jgi:hypothetical protein
VSTLVDFLPTAIAPFQFQPTLNGTQYQVTIPWNIFRQNFYMNLSDLQGNQIAYKALISGGPSLQAVFSWSQQVVTAVTAMPHNVPVGSPANVRVSQTSEGFDGFFRALSTGASTLTYPLAVNPQDAPQGTLSFPLNLVAGYLDNCFLFFSDTTMQFEFSG